MSDNELLNKKRSNLMKALKREGADYVPTMMASSCAEVAWTGRMEILFPEHCLHRRLRRFWSPFRTSSVRME